MVSYAIHYKVKSMRKWQDNQTEEHKDEVSVTPGSYNERAVASKMLSVSFALASCTLRSAKNWAGGEEEREAEQADAPRPKPKSASNCECRVSVETAFAVHGSRFPGAEHADTRAFR